MKKVLAMILALVMVFSLVACTNEEGVSSGSESSNAATSGSKDETTSSEIQNDDKDNNSTDEISDITKSEWNFAVQSQKFENVTFAYNVTFISDYDNDGPYVGMYKLTENGMLYGDRLGSEEEKNAVKAVFVDTAVAVANNFNQFDYNKNNNNYTSKESITYNVTVLEYEAAITCDDVIVTFDEAINIAKISCKMTQKFNEGGESKTYVLNAEFTFTDYGTTTLE